MVHWSLITKKIENLKFDELLNSLVELLNNVVVLPINATVDEEASLFSHTT